jgi:uncharacterized protein
MADDTWTISAEEELRALYPPVNERSRLKQIDHLDEHCRAFIAASPFFVIGTCGPAGVDCSPRGDPVGSVLMADEKTLLIPDRRGNNRLDCLCNLLKNPAVGLLFLVPGVNETLRVNGRARITTDPALLARLAMDGRPPVTVIEVTVDEAFVQCGRALMRSDLWNPDARVDRASVPSMGTMLAAHTGGAVEAASYDADLPDRLTRELY